MLIFTLKAAYAECRYAECRYAEGRGAHDSAKQKKSFMRFAPEDEGLGSAEQERDEPGYHDHLKKILTLMSNGLAYKHLVFCLVGKPCGKLSRL